MYDVCTGHVLLILVDTLGAVILCILSFQIKSPGQENVSTFRGHN